MVSSIFQEVDEEIRRERLKKLWDRYGGYLLALAVIIVVAVGGWRSYEWYQNKRAAEAGAAFELAAQLANQGKLQEAEAAFGKIAAESTAGYRALARFREAAAQVTRDAQAAVKAFDSIASDGTAPALLRDLASIRAGLIAVDQVKYEEFRARLEPLSGADRAFRHTARELLAISAWRSGEFKASQRWSEMILGDSEAPGGARNRAEMLLALLADELKS